MKNKKNTDNYVQREQPFVDNIFKKDSRGLPLMQSDSGTKKKCTCSDHHDVHRAEKRRQTVLSFPAPLQIKEEFL